MAERRNVLEIMNGPRELLRRIQTRIDLLYTMSEIPHAHPVRDATCEVMFRGRFKLEPSDHWSARLRLRLRRARFDLRLLHGRATRSPKGKAWWSQTGSNRRPHACKARAL